MVGGQVYLVKVQNQSSELLSHLDEALAADTFDELCWHVGESMAFAQSMHDQLDEALSLTDDPDAADRIEECMDHLSTAMDLGDQAEGATEEELASLISEIRKYAEQSNVLLGEVIGVDT